MTIYSQQDYNNEVTKGKELLRKENETLYNTLSQYLEQLKNEDYSDISKFRFARTEFENTENKLDKILNENYPKTDEFFIDGNVRYTFETAIHFSLLTDYNSFRNEYQKLYGNFLASFFG